MIAISEDRPIVRIEDDLFDRAPVADMISNAIIHKAAKEHGCYVIGVYGKWGEGKSTIFNFVKERLLSNKNDKILISEFNPWLFRDQESLLMDFFNTLAKEPVGRVLSKKFKEYAPIVAFGIKRLAPAAEAIGAMHGMSGMGAIATTIGETTEKLDKAIPKIEVGAATRKKEISETLRKSGKHLVIFIDDIDRLYKEETHAIFKLIKQNADFDNVIYLLAMDVEMVAKSISNRFGAGKMTDGYNFIEKIVQVPVTLPKIQKSRLKLLLDKQVHETLLEMPTVHESVTEHLATCADEIVKIVSELFETRRDVVRYINQLQFVLPTLYAEVNVSDLCLLEAVKLFHPAGYNVILQNKDVIFHTDFEWSMLYVLHRDDQKELHLRENELRDKFFDKIMMGCQECYSTKIGKIIKANLLSGFFGSFVRPLGKRLSNSNYFDKYFIGYTPDDKISDTQFFVLSKHISETDYYQNAVVLNDFLQRYDWDEVQRAVEFIVGLKKTLPEQNVVASGMAISIALMNFEGLNLNHIDVPYSICIILQQLYLPKARTQDNYRRDETLIHKTCKTIIEIATLDFLPSFARTINEHLNISDDITKLTVGRIIAERGTNGLFGVYSFDRVHLFNVWAQMNYAEMERCVADKLRDTDFNAAQFLESFIKERSDGARTISMIFSKSQPIHDAINERFSEDQIKNNAAVQAIVSSFNISQ